MDPKAVQPKYALGERERNDMSGERLLRFIQWAAQEVAISEKLSKRENWTPELRHAYRVGVFLGIWWAAMTVAMFLFIQWLL